MCGIAGKLFFDPESRVERADIQSMLTPIAHRGPDGQGIYLDRHLGLGHCRLSIIDLATGTQPMTNEDKSVWIVFNGEIYNFKELRAELIGKGHIFRTNSDTEVIVHLYEDLGQDCVTRLRGMFAFAVWDSKRKNLFIARDRVGIKPLYYLQTDDAFYFASELKAIIACPEVTREIHLPAIRNFLSFNYVPGEETLLRGIFKLLPGNSLLIANKTVQRRQYWDLEFTESRFGLSFSDASDELHQLLQATVRDHMMADVPVGVLLSGGVDSSAVLSLAAQSTTAKISTFTVGFDGKEVVDERPYARSAALRFGSDHHEISITAEDFWNFLPGYVWHMEEPVCEPPAVALYYVSKLARDHVKVVLSGEGGDEAFAGYPNYPNMMRSEAWAAAAGPLARPAGSAASLLGSLFGDPRLRRYGHGFGRSLGDHYFSRTSNPTALFNQEANRFFTPDFLAGSASVSPSRFVKGLLDRVPGECLLNQMLYVDSKTWLPDDLLIKADKITMANSIELRVPLLDHKVLEFAASLPAGFKVRGRETKRVLKAAFGRTLPAEVIERKKAGFPVPYEKWLRSDFSENVRNILLSTPARDRGYFESKEVRRLIDNHQKGGQLSKEIFSLLAVELWHSKFVDQRPQPAQPQTSDGERPPLLFDQMLEGLSVKT